MLKDATDNVQGISNAVKNLSPSLGLGLTLGDGEDLTIASTTGSKIGQADSKIGFFGATPVVVPTSTTDLKDALVALGLYTTGGATPLNLDGGAITALSVTFSGDSSSISSFSDATVTGKVLTGYVKSSGAVADTDNILTALGKLETLTDNATVIGRVLTGYTKGAGTVASTDSILAAIQKLDANDDAKLATDSFTDAAVTGKLLTGFAASAGTVAATDSLLVALNKLAANDVSTTVIKLVNVTDASLSAAIAFATSLRTTLLAHFASTGSGVGAHSAADETSGAGVSGATITDLSTLLARAGEMLTAYDTHEGDAELAESWAYHLAQEAGDHSLSSAVTPTTLAEAFTRLADLQTKLNAHDADDTAHDEDSTTQSSADLHAYTVLSTDQIVHLTVLDAGFSIVIPTALLVEGRTLTVKDAAAGATASDITISTEGSEDIDGADTKVIDADYGVVTLYSDGTNWFTM
jgi:hypothetical protein